MGTEIPRENNIPLRSYRIKLKYMTMYSSFPTVSLVASSSATLHPNSPGENISACASTGFHFSIFSSAWVRAWSILQAAIFFSASDLVSLDFLSRPVDEVVAHPISRSLS